MNKKQQTLENLNTVYCRLKQSPIHGIGIFAIRDIPAGTNPFELTPDDDWVGYEESELKDLHPNIKKMIVDFCVKDGGKVWLPKTGFNNMNVGWYLNHSDTPNMRATKQGEVFIAIKDIKEGDELCVDYGTYSEDINI